MTWNGTQTADKEDGTKLREQLPELFFDHTL